MMTCCWWATTRRGNVCDLGWQLPSCASGALLKPGFMPKWNRTVQFVAGGLEACNDQLAPSDE